MYNLYADIVHVPVFKAVPQTLQQRYLPHSVITTGINPPYKRKIIKLHQVLLQ